MKKGFAVLEIALWFAAWQLIISLVRGLPLVQWERQTYGWTFLVGLAFVLFPLLILWAARRRFREYGFSLANARQNLETGMRAYLLALIPWGAGLGIMVLLQARFNTPLGAVVLACGYGIAIFLFLRSTRREKPPSSLRANLILLAALVTLPVWLGAMTGRLTLSVVITVLWQFTISGFGEEIVWRGYVQSRLNQAFGKPWTLLGTAVGPGLVIASLGFGLSHAFNTFDPAGGKYELAWAWAAWTSFSGLFLGIIREKTGSLLAPGIAHGAPDAVGEGLARLFGWVM